MQQSLHKMENDLKEARRERDKTLQQLNRLKQHLLEKVYAFTFFFIGGHHEKSMSSNKEIVLLYNPAY